MRALVCTQIYECLYAHTCMHAYIHACACIYAACTHTWAHTQTCSHTHTHTHTLSHKKTEKPFCVKFELLRADLLLPMESRKQLAGDIFDTFASHVGLVMTSLSRTLLGTKWQHSFSVFFATFQLSIFKNGLRNQVKNCWVPAFFILFRPY